MTVYCKGMDIRAEIIREVEDYVATAGIAESYLGALATKDSRLVARIREGRATVRSIEKLRAYMAAVPPQPKPRRRLA